MKLFKTSLAISLVLSLVSACEKEYYPNQNTYRDSDLIGTWIEKYTKTDSTILVLTKEGYMGYIDWYEDEMGYFGISSIWHNIRSIDSTTGTGLIYTRSMHSNWQNRGWVYKMHYKFSLHKDTLYIKTEDDSTYDIYHKSKYQLIYDGPNYVGIDSTNID